MKIVLISQNASPGLLVFRIDFIRFLVSKGYVVYCFAIDFNDLDKARLIELGAIPVDYKLSKSGINPIGDIIDTLCLARKLYAIQADVVLSFFVKPSIYGTIASWLARVPRRVAMLEGLGYIYTNPRSGCILKRSSLQFVHGVLATIGYSLAHDVLFLNADDPVDLSRRAWISREKVKIIGPIGLDFSKYEYSPISDITHIRFVFVARLLADKGIFEYIEAARLVKKIYPDAEFYVLGGLDLFNPTALSKRELTAVLQEGLINYPGHVENVSEWVTNSHVFVLPSYREGFPRSTQEAMAIGRAVITTDVPGCRETVINGTNGFIVPPMDPQALAEKMIFLIEHPDKLRSMGDESHRIAVRDYDVNKINPVLASIVTGEIQ